MYDIYNDIYNDLNFIYIYTICLFYPKSVSFLPFRINFPYNQS